MPPKEKVVHKVLVTSDVIDSQMSPGSIDVPGLNALKCEWDLRASGPIYSEIMK